MLSDAMKNPISMLQERCQKECPRNMPKYSEVSDDNPSVGNVNDRKFIIICEAFGYKSTGHGANKKIAKHRAAEKLLMKLERKGHDIDEDDIDDLDFSNCSTSDFVSDLLDYCVHRDFPKPEYVDKKQIGPSHAPEFTIECHVASVTTVAIENNKKMARHSAAQKMLSELKAGCIDEKSIALFENKSPNNNITGGLKYKVANYLELKKSGKVSEMGCALRDRHNFFIKKLNCTEDLDPLREILNSDEEDSPEKFEKFQDELKKSFSVVIDNFLHEETNLKQFEVIIPGNVFTCIIIGSNDELWKNVLDYFRDILKTN